MRDKYEINELNPRKNPYTKRLKKQITITCELKDGGLFMRKKQSTAQMFEEFYGKPFEEITQADLDNLEEIDWGEDVGGEIY